MLYANKANRVVLRVPQRVHHAPLGLALPGTSLVSQNIESYQREDYILDLPQSSDPRESV